LIGVLVLAGGSVFIPGKLTNAIDWVARSDFAVKVKGTTETEIARQYHMIEMDVDSVRVSRQDHKPVVILKEKGAERYLPVWIGPPEATAIGLALEGVSTPRPLTHDLACSIMDALGGSVNFVIINDLQDDVFYAKVVLSADGGQMGIDSRPSDALAIALRVEAPIYAEEAVLDEAGISLEGETEKFVFSGERLCEL
jgi:hypothetical protein